MDAPHDRKLLDAAARGDAAAFGEFCRRHVDSLIAFFLHRTGSAEVAADLAHETWVEALELDETDRQQLERFAAVLPVATPALDLPERLPEPQREAIRARMLDEQEYPEIARDLQCSQAVVRQRVSRGLRTLREGLER